MMAEISQFRPWIERWSLTPDGAPFESLGGRSRLLPVLANGEQAMLKLGVSDDERRGSVVMAWWNGEGAAPVLAHDGQAILMRRGEQPEALAELAHTNDEAATRIICGVVADLHRRRPDPPDLPPLDNLFASLRRAGSTDGRFAAATAVADELLASQRDVVVLHGDIHHRNILRFASDGWLAIDPWGYVGERAYDYANLLKNPDAALATAPGRFERQVVLIARIANLDSVRLRRWAFAHAALSATWSMEDGEDPSLALAVMDLAGAAL